MFIPYWAVALPLAGLLLSVFWIIGWAWRQEFLEMKEKYAATDD